MPLVNRNRGPIAQAEAAREAAGTNVLEVQDSVLHDLEEAQAGYDAALAALAWARELERGRRAEVETVRRAVQAGEEDALAEALTRAGWEASRADEVTAGSAAQTALGRLEDALEQPLFPATPLPLLPRQGIAQEENP